MSIKPALATTATAGLNRPISQNRKTSAESILQRPPIEIPTRDSLARDTANFAADVGKVFRQAGISVPPNPTLQSDFQGYVRVANDHPDKEKIEQIFKDNPELQQRYAKISAKSSLMRAAENHSRFVAEYERLQNNPAGQKALVEAAIAYGKAPFFMTITANGAEPFFGVSVSA